MKKPVVLAVDDNPDMLGYLQRLLGGELGVDVLSAENGKDALNIVQHGGVWAVLTDIRMPGMDGVDLLQKLRELDSSVIVLMMTAYGSIESAVETLKLGAYDFITKPFEEERLLHTVRMALEHHSLLRRTHELEQQVMAGESKKSFVGNAPVIKEMLNTIGIVARTGLSVLIMGETGTGKELAARLTHSLSNRADKPFVALSCPTIPEDILESELFGYKKGAFTGAVSDRAGLFESADGGTLVLDEIGDISTVLQTKLLRVLQEREIKPLGDNQTRKVDVRIIASTNQDLREKISAGQFREDLYHRLNGVSIHTIPLREIPEDIPLIANHFIDLYALELAISPKKLSEDAIRLLASRKWTGNVRELQNEVRRALIFSKGDVIQSGDFDTATEIAPQQQGCTGSLCDTDYRRAKNMMLEKFNLQYITGLLSQLQGNVSLAARKAGMERQSLQYLLRKYGISASDFRKSAKKN